MCDQPEQQQARREAEAEEAAELLLVGVVLPVLRDVGYLICSLGTVMRTRR